MTTTKKFKDLPIGQEFFDKVSGESFVKHSQTHAGMTSGGDAFEGQSTYIGPDEEVELIFNTDQLVNDAKPRVLVLVRGGVATTVSDDNAEVVIFDADNFNDDPTHTEKIPAHFRDLAQSGKVDDDMIEDGSNDDENPAPSMG